MVVDFKLSIVAAWCAPLCAGFNFMEALLKSPVYDRVLVPMARRTMIETARKNGVPWESSVEWLAGARAWAVDAAEADVAVPAYYANKFHAYADGNLCWEAAFEQEPASRAVGARNYPAFGADGEGAFRGAFDDALASIGAAVPDGAVVVDVGCGTGVSTRRLAAAHPTASEVVGVDLSPHFLAVARALPALCAEAAGRWVNAVAADGRVTYLRADASDLPWADGSVDVVSLSLVVHELPPAATRAALAEARRVLRPGGQLWLSEMDFDTDGYVALRASPPYALIRATEPYLDVYADYGAAGVAADAAAVGFGAVRAVAATGRHFALVADASAGGPTVDDRRRETALPDTHLATWESAAKGT